MAEYSRVAKGSFTSTAASKYINLPFQPDSVEMWNFTAAGTPAQNGVPYAYWDVQMGQGTATAQYFNATPVLSTGNVTTNGISSFAATSILLGGPAKQVIGITKASQAVVNVTAHGYSVGDTVSFSGLYQTSTTGMPQITNVYFTIVAVGDADHFTIQWNTNQSNYTAISGSPAGATVSRISFPFIYPPGYINISAITTGSTTTITTTGYHNFEVGQEIAFRIPPIWGTIELNSLPNLIVPGSPVYGYVISITDNWTFVCNINSTSYTAFDSNIPVADVPGLTPAQVLAVGDVNTGGQSITATSPLYPPPLFPTSTNRVPTINGPAIKGAFVNASSQGFVIGTGSLTGLSSTSLVGANGNIIYWRAYLSDYVNP